VKITKSGLVKWCLLSIGFVSIFSSLFFLSTPTARAVDTIWAQCGADSYVECGQTPNCRAVDDRGCWCWDAKKRIRHYLK